MAMSLQHVLEARRRIQGFIHTTPVMQSLHLNERTGSDLFFKCEHLQKTGAFKARGAANAVFALSDEKAKTGVATHSSGNHGAHWPAPRNCEVYLLGLLYLKMRCHQKRQR